MKNLTRLFVLATLASFAPLPPANAANVTWDIVSGDGATITGGTGAWTNGAGNWNTGAGDTTWSNANPDNGTFGGTAGAVTLGGAITAGTVTFNSAGYNVNTNGNTATWGTLAGTGGFTKSGAGTLTLSGASTASGTVQVTAGTLSLGNNTALGTSTLNLAGGAISATSTRSLTNSIVVTAATSTDIINGGNGDISYKGPISGSGTLVINSATSRSVWFQDDTGGFTGTVQYTNVNNGTNFRLGGTDTIVNTLTTGSNWSGAAFVLSGTTTSTRGLSWNGLAGTTVQLGSLSGTGIVNNTSNAANWQIGALNTSTTYSGTIIGTGASLTKVGSGSLTLSGANTYTGNTTISRGTIVAANNSALGTGSVVINDTNTGSNNTALLIDSSAASITINRPISIANQGTGTVTLGTSNSAAGNQTIFTGAITLAKSVTLQGSPVTSDRTQFSGGISGTGNVTISGAQRVIFLTTANTYNGTTTVNSGSTLQLSDATATATSLIPDASAVIVNGTLNIAKGNNNETIGSLAGSGLVQGHPAVANIATSLTIGGDNTSTNFTGTLSNGGASGATLALTKIGTGAQTLSGANTYSAGTTISSGTLIWNNTSAFGTGLVTLNDASTGANNVSLLSSLDAGATLANNITVSNNGTGTVTIGSNGGSVSGGTNYSGTLTLNRATTLQGMNTDKTRYSGQITGNVGTLTISGGQRTTVMSTANNFTGDIVITGSGTRLQASEASAGEVIPNGSSVDVGAGAFFQLAGSANSTETINALTGSGTVTHNVAGLQTLSLGSAGGGGTFSGLIQNGSGTLAITKGGAATQIFSGANTYTGATTVNGGTLKAGIASVANVSGAFGNNSAVTLADTAGVVLDITGFDTQIGSLAGGGVNGGNVTLGAATLSVGGNNTTTTYSGVMSGTGNLTKIGSGSLSLSGTTINTFSGLTTVSAGTLNLDKSSALTNAIGGDLLIKSGATARISGAGNDQLKNTALVTIETGGTYDWGGTFENIGGLAGSGAVTGMPTANVVGVLGGFTSTFNGSMAGTGTGPATGNYAAMIFRASGASTVQEFGTGANISFPNAGMLANAGSTIRFEGTSVANVKQLHAGLLNAVNDGGAITITEGATVTIGSGGWTAGGTGTGNLGGGTGTAKVIASAGSTWTAPLTLSTGTTNPQIDTGANAVIISSVLSGSGGFIKLGSGSLTLSSGNGYAGGTTITAGTVVASNATSLGTGTVTMNGGTLNTSVNLANDFTLNNTTNTLAPNGNYRILTGKLSGAGGFIVANGGVTPGLALANAANDFAGNITINAGAFLRTDVSEVIPDTATVTVNGSLKLSDAGGTTETIAGLSGAGLVFQSNGSPGNNLLRVGAGNTTSSFTGTLGGSGHNNNFRLEKIGSGSLTLSGASVFSGGTTITQGTVVASIASALGTGTITMNGGTLNTSVSLTNNITLNNTTNTFAPNGFYHVLSGKISGPGGFTVANGGGTPGLELNNTTNDFGGNVIINAGTYLRLTASEVLTNTASVTNNGNLRLDAPGGGTETISGLTGTGTVWVPTANNTLQTLAVGFGNTSSTYNGTLGDTSQNNAFLALKKIGTGTLTLGGNSLYSAGTTISQGTIVARNSGALGAGGTVTVNDAATGANDTSLLIDSSAGNVNIARAINVTNNGTGTVILGTSNSAAGNQSNFSGAITIAKDVTLQGASVPHDRTDFRAGISGTGNVTITGTQRVIFLNANFTYNGSTTVSTGSILQLGEGPLNNFSLIPDNSAVTMNGTLNLAKGALAETFGALSGNATGLIQGHPTVTNVASGIIVGADNGSATYHGALANGGASGATLSFAKTGAGTQTLTGTNTYSGGTTISGGTLQLGNGGATGTFGTGNVVNNAALVFNRNNTYAVSNVISGSGTVSQIGTGATQFTGGVANSYSGLTTITAGVLELAKTNGVTSIAGDANTGTNDVLVNGGTLLHSASEQIADNASINMTSGAWNLNGRTETIYAFTNSGGAFTTGVGGDLIGLGTTINWAGGTNTINADGSTTDSHYTITGGANTVQGAAGPAPGVAGGQLIVATPGGVGLVFGGASSPTITVNSDATSAGGIVLNNNVTVDNTLTSGTAQILNGGSATNPGYVDLGAGTRTFDINNGSDNVDMLVSARIQNGALTKTGAGTLRLTGDNTYTGATTVNAGTVELPAPGTLRNGSIAVNAGTFLQNGGTNNVTGTGGNLDVAAGASYQLQGGLLNFGDYAAGGTAWSPADTSAINLASGNQFSFTGGALVDVSQINVGGALPFTQSGGDFFVGQIGAGPAAETTINGGFDLLGGVLRLDVFGDDLTPDSCCDGVASNNDQLTVAGEALLDSAVSLNFVGGYEPEFGDVLTLICAEEITLDDGFFIDGGFFRVVPTGNEAFPFALQAMVPEPASVAVWTLIGLAGAAGACRLRRVRK